MTPRLLALLVAVVLACSSQAACAQENVLNVGKYGQLSSYDPHAGGLDPPRAAHRARDGVPARPVRHSSRCTSNTR